MRVISVKMRVNWNVNFGCKKGKSESFGELELEIILFGIANLGFLI